MTDQYIFPETYGLVVCGGKSSRMNSDKSTLQYFDKPQRYYVYDMLLSYCEAVFLSCNKEQIAGIQSNYNFIQDDDSLGDIGPMKALLTAFKNHPDKNILLLGCDYPFFNSTELQMFSKVCNNMPAAFYNHQDSIYEPMLAWYPYTNLPDLEEMYVAKQYALQQFLKKHTAVKHAPLYKISIKSIDTKADFEQAVKLINAG